jgi:cytoskeletal protein CcmA (bactofilin family)
MFGNSKKLKSTKVDTLVGQNTQIQGDIHFSGGLHIDGVVKGNVMADSNSNAVLTLSELGTIEGEVRVPHIVLNGSIVGDVFASERIELAVKARVNGNVYYNLLEMVMGAEVNGSLVHKQEASEASPVQVKTKSSHESPEPQGGTLSEIMESMQVDK